jgi:hypothetical protein
MVEFAGNIRRCYWFSDYFFCASFSQIHACVWQGHSFIITCLAEALFPWKPYASTSEHNIATYNMI